MSTASVTPNIGLALIPIGQNNYGPVENTNSLIVDQAIGALQTSLVPTPYSATVVYPKGQTVTYTDGSGNYAIYQSLLANNLGNPPSYAAPTTYWIKTAQNGPQGSIASPVNNQVQFNQGFTANGFAVTQGDPSTQVYPVTLAGGNGIEFAGIDAAGGLHWDGPITALGPITAPSTVVGPMTAASVDPATLNAANTAIVLSGNNGFGFGTVDMSGNVTLDGGLTVHGALSLTAALNAPAQTGAVVDADGWNYSTATDTGGKLQIFQNYGALTNQLTFGGFNSWGPQLSADGTYLCFMSDRPMAGSATTINAYRMNLGGSEQVPLSFNPDLSLQTDVSILGVAGQSLAGGAQSGNTDIPSAYGHNLSLQGGPMQLGSYGDGNPTSLVPLVEVSDGNGGGETPCSAMSNQFAFLCSRFKGFLPTIASQSSARGGSTLDALFSPTIWYPKMTAGLAVVTSLAQSTLSRKAFVRGIGFVHGESDGNVPSAGNMNYAGELLTYYLRWIQDLGTATGTFTAPPLFLTQTSSEYSYSGHTQNVISPQQLAACLNNPGRFYMAGPEYPQQESYAVAGVHEFARGYDWNGSLIGTAAFRALVLKQRRTGLMPKQAVKQGNSIYLTFYVPKPLGVAQPPSLTFDRTNIPDITANGVFSGFEARTASDTLVPVTNAAILNDAEGNPTIVRLDCQRDPGVGGTVGFANTYQAISGASQDGPSGNLRTLWGVPALYPTIQANATYGDLFDWCSHFKMPYTS